MLPPTPQTDFKYLRVWTLSPVDASCRLGYLGYLAIRISLDAQHHHDRRAPWPSGLGPRYDAASEFISLVPVTPRPYPATIHTLVLKFPARRGRSRPVPRRRRPGWLSRARLILIYRVSEAVLPCGAYATRTPSPTSSVSSFNAIQSGHAGTRSQHLIPTSSLTPPTLHSHFIKLGPSR